ncbi:glycosyl hydrolase family 28-related protein [Brevundimonas olei]|uniref:glycosyl hydrolase family 28-related protein n=1 Tax=Brevundimonas olei TaxID=657642 RepID=UPI0031CE8008
MARLIIPDEPTSITFQATAQTVFPISFALFGKENLRVFVDDDELQQADFTFSGSILEGGGYQGGTVTLASAVTGEVKIERDVRPVRASNYAPSNYVPVQAVDQALNRLTAQQQDIRRTGLETADLATALQGDLEAVAAAAFTGAVDVSTREIAQLAHIPSTIKAVRTSGYSIPGDLGAALYRRISSEPPHAGKFQSADGSWWELSESVVTPQMLGARGDGIADDWQAIQNALTCGAGRSVYIPAGIYKCTKPLYVWRSTSVFGDDPDPLWGGSTSGYGTNTGSIIDFQGEGVSARWTDIDGSDPATFRPGIIFAGSGINLERITVRKIDGAAATSVSDLWSAAIFNPSQARCRVSRVTTVGKWYAGYYVDATWGPNNTTLRDLHPAIEDVQSAIELVVEGCWLRGLWGAVVKGTTRDPAGYTSSTWLWSPAGTSDHRWIDNRFEGGDRWYMHSSLRASDGGCYYHDAAAQSSPEGVGQGHSFMGNSFRTAAKYLVLLDRSNNDKFSDNYGETNVSGIGVKPFAITSRTRYVSLVNDSITASFMVDDVERRDRLSNLLPTDIADTLFSIHRVTGAVVSANAHFPGSNSSLGSSLISGQSDGQVVISKRASGVLENLWQITGTSLRPFGQLIRSLGDPSNRLLNGFYGALNLNSLGSGSSASILHGSGNPEGVVTASKGSMYLNVGSGAPMWAKTAGGNTGWQSVTLSGTNGA